MTNWTNQQTSLRQALAQLREDEQAARPSHRVEQAVLAAWDAQHASDGHHQATATIRWHAVWPIAAAILLGATAMQGLVMRRAGDVARVATSETRNGSVASPVEPAITAMPAVFVVNETVSASEHLTTVRMEVPVEHLVRFGIEPYGTGTGTAVLEVLVAEDGVARSAKWVW
jgi:hypothetical protein